MRAARWMWSEVEAVHRRQCQLFGHGHRFGFLHQSDNQIVGHALLIVVEEGVPAGGKVRLFHQLGQVLDGAGAEFQEVDIAG